VFNLCLFLNLHRCSNFKHLTRFFIMSLNLQSHTISQRKSLKLKGTKTSVTKNQILISSGIVSLDAVLGKDI